MTCPISALSSGAIPLSLPCTPTLSQRTQMDPLGVLGVRALLTLSPSSPGGTEGPGDKSQATGLQFWVLQP